MNTYPDLYGMTSDYGAIADIFSDTFMVSFDNLKTILACEAGQNRNKLTYLHKPSKPVFVKVLTDGLGRGFDESLKLGLEIAVISPPTFEQVCQFCMKRMISVSKNLKNRKRYFNGSAYTRHPCNDITDLAAIGV